MPPANAEHDVITRFRSPRRLHPTTNSGATVVFVDGDHVVLDNGVRTQRVPVGEVTELLAAHSDPGVSFRRPGIQVLQVVGRDDDVLASLSVYSTGPTASEIWNDAELEAFADRLGIGWTQLGKHRRQWLTEHASLPDETRPIAEHRRIMVRRALGLAAALVVAILVALVWPTDGALGVGIAAGLSLGIFALMTVHGRSTVQESDVLDSEFLGRDDVTLLGDPSSVAAMALVDRGEAAGYVPGLGRYVVGEVSDGVRLRWQSHEVVLICSAESRAVTIPLVVDRAEAEEFCRVAGIEFVVDEPDVSSLKLTATTPPDFWTLYRSVRASRRLLALIAAFSFLVVAAASFFVDSVVVLAPLWLVATVISFLVASRVSRYVEIRNESPSRG